ncbi:MAG TPA: lipopolysaccharide kinase InaA family protein [bacterium]
MFDFSGIKKGNWKILCRNDLIPKLKQLFDSPGKFVPAHIKKTYMESPNLVADIELSTGETLNVKIFGWRSRLHLILSPFRRAKSLRTYLTAKRLLENNVPTPQPICIMEKRRWGFLKDDIYISEFITDYVTVRDFLQKQPEGYSAAKAIIPYLADYVKQIHRSGVWHRDLHLTNFLMKRNKKGEPVFYLVDLNRAKLFKKMGETLRIFDIGKMDLHEFRIDFLDLYLDNSKNRLKLERLFYFYIIFRRLRKKILRLLKIKK